MKKEGEEEQEEEKEKKKREKKKGKKTKEKMKEEKKKEEEMKRFLVCSCVSVTTPGRHNAKSGVSSSWRSSQLKRSRRSRSFRDPPGATFCRETQAGRNGQNWPKRGGNARRGTESPSLVERGEPGLQAGPWEEGIFPVKKIFLRQKTFLTRKS